MKKHFVEIKVKQYHLPMCSMCSISHPLSKIRQQSLHACALSIATQPTNSGVIIIKIKMLIIGPRKPSLSEFSCSASSLPAVSANKGLKRLTGPQKTLLSCHGPSLNVKSCWISFCIKLCFKNIRRIVLKVQVEHKPADVNT